MWRTNGTTAETTLVEDIRPGDGGSNPHALTNFNGELFFAAMDSVYGDTANGYETGNTELWKSTGDPGGTTLVKDIRVGFKESLPSDLTDVDGILFFAAFDETNGRELWSSDGTTAGTTLVKDIRPGSDNGVEPQTPLTAVDGTLFFSARDGIHGY